MAVRCHCLAALLAAVICGHLRPAAADIYVVNDDINATVTSMDDAPSAFGPVVGTNGLEGPLMISQPLNGCTSLNVSAPMATNRVWIVLIERGDCNFQEKVLNAQRAGFGAAIVYNVGSDAVRPMHGDGTKDIAIPSFFVGQSNGIMLKRFTNASRYHLRITSGSPFDFADYLIPFAVVIAVCFVVLVGIMIYRCWADHRRLTRHRLPKRILESLPVTRFDKAVHTYETCAICLDDYEEGEQLRILPCNHAYHTKCVDPWLTRSRRVCPVCKQRVRLSGDTEAAGSDSDDAPPADTEREPLIERRQRRGYGATAGGRDRAAAASGSSRQETDPTQPPRRPYRSSRRSRRQQRAAAAASRAVPPPPADSLTPLQEEEPTLVTSGDGAAAAAGPSDPPAPTHQPSTGRDLHGRRQTSRGYRPLQEDSDGDTAGAADHTVEAPITDQTAAGGTPMEPVVLVVSPEGGRPRAGSSPEPGPAAAEPAVLVVSPETGDGPDGRGDDRV